MRKSLLIIILMFISLFSDGRTYYFMSFHLYTNENDKYEEKGVVYSPSIVEINEENNEAVLRLYINNEDNKGWLSFNFTIIKKLFLDNDIIVYIIQNNIEEKGYIYLSPMHKNGLFIDINNFFINNQHLCCWMQEPIKISN